MREALVQSLQNLRANKLRSFLTMFGILWGVISIVILSATGEGFQLGNQHVLEQLGENIAIVFPGRTSMQAGGQRAGRRVILTAGDARALATQSPMVAVVSPEIERDDVSVKSRYNSASASVQGVEPAYQQIRTLDLEYGRPLNWQDEQQVHRVAIIGADMLEQLFGRRNALGQTISLNGIPYTVVGKIRKKDQDSNYSGPDNRKIFVPFSAMEQDLPIPDGQPGQLSDIIVAPKPWVVAELPKILAARTGSIEEVDWPLAREIRHVLARRHGFNPDDKDAVPVWDTSLETLLFARMIDNMRQFFMIVGFITLALGGIGVMNIMLVAVKERTREIGVRKALGATTWAVERQFFLEGFFLTMLSGGIGMGVALLICHLINLLPMPERFAGMIVSWQSGAMAVGTLALIGVVTATYPARRAAQLPPVEALRFEM
ncbi:MAG TPA: ABC transporter permease [Vicinamibacterales bacterium]|nr:ABC transporter permease [Vicinamibacterales bacterium]